MRIISVNVAQPRDEIVDGSLVRTAIGKRPIAGAVPVHTFGLAGDGRADVRRLGESHHAVSVLPEEHYDHWRERLCATGFPLGSFGENLTTRDLDEKTVRIGDVWRCGRALLQVAQPRIPCRKWRHQLGLSSVRPILESRRLGFYLRVLEAGTVSAGVEIELVESDEASPSVDEMIRVTQFDYWDALALERLLRAPSLMPAWRTIIEDKLERSRKAEGWHGSRPLCVSDMRESADDPHVLRVTLRCPEGRLLAPFMGGQCVMITLHRESMDTVLRHSFYLISKVTELDHYEIAVPRLDALEAPEGEGSVASPWQQIERGASLRVAAPRGLHTLSALHPDSKRMVIVCDAAGSAAALGLLQQAITEHPKLECTVAHCDKRTPLLSALESCARSHPSARALHLAAVTLDPLCVEPVSAKIAAILGRGQAEVFLFGSAHWLAGASAWVRSRGVAVELVHG